jgi:hypothetical protein
LVASPPYAAVTLCVPTARVLVVHLAVRLLPVPARAIAEQPLIEVAASLKLTDPVGDVPETVAVKVTAVPAIEGVSEVVTAIVFGSALTTCERAVLVEAALLASPP